METYTYAPQDKKSKAAGIVLKVLITAAALFLSFWFILPPLNLRSPDFWRFLIFALILTAVIWFFASLKSTVKKFTETGIQKPQLKGLFGRLGKIAKIWAAIFGVIILVLIVGKVSGLEIFNAARYNKLLTMSDGDFAKDVAEIERTQIPVVDRDTASRLSQRKLGEISDLVSQFEIEDIFTQINYKDRPVRVSPLIYGDPIKWLNNQKNGIPAYVSIDMTTQEASLVRLKEGIKYSNGEYFMRKLGRYLRFKYPTEIFGSVSFEIDENGTPFWVASTIKYRIGLWSGADVDGVILLNAVTGECEKFDIADAPTWIDQAYDSEMVISQLNYNGKYRSGFFNSIFGQKGVLQATEGYNYLAINDDVYLYTGMTSVTSDESNVGFVLVNLRTKETSFYSVPGAEEFSAMASAEGQVQHLSYTATFPLLLNISDRPTYFMSLKDGAGLVKMYSFVDVQQYQIVGTGNSVEAAREDYIKKLRENNEDVISTDETNTLEGTIERISSAVIDGNTVYFLKITDSEQIFRLPISLSEKLALAREGDGISLTYTGSGANIIVSKIVL